MRKVLTNKKKTLLAQANIVEYILSKLCSLLLSIGCNCNTESLINQCWGFKMPSSCSRLEWKRPQFEIFYSSWNLLDPVNVSHNSLSHFYNWCWVQVSYWGEVYCRHRRKSHGNRLAHTVRALTYIYMRRCCKYKSIKVVNLNWPGSLKTVERDRKLRLLLSSWRILYSLF